MKVFIILAEGFEEIEAVTPIDVLRRAGLDVTVVGLADGSTRGAHGISFVADKPWNEVAEETPDVLVLPGGMPGSKNLGEHGGLKSMAERIARSGGILAAICAAPAFTLAAWGLLSGRRATCYPGCEGQFPAEVQYVTESVVVDGPFITACGPGVALPFSFALVEQLVGVSKVEELKSQMRFS